MTTCKHCRQAISKYHNDLWFDPGRAGLHEPLMTELPTSEPASTRPTEVGTDDERWELAHGPRRILIAKRKDGTVGVQLEDPSEIAFVKFTGDEVYRIAYELLRRSGKATTQVLQLLHERLPVE